jgi:hypothetical protein
MHLPTPLPPSAAHLPIFPTSHLATVHTNADKDNHMITLSSDKCFQLDAPGHGAGGGGDSGA